MFPDMYLQYNHPTSKSQQKPFDKNRHPHTTNTTSHSIHHSADVNSPHNASSAAPMPHHLPANHKETQPFAPSIQRSADAPSPTGKPLNLPLQTNLPPSHPSPTALNLTARAGDAVWSASAGGELILGWRKSALFFKSPLSERLQDASSDFCKTLLADSRQPRSQPTTKPRRQAAHASRASLFTKKSRTSHIPQPVQLTPYNYKLTHHQPRQAASR